MSLPGPASIVPPDRETQMRLGFETLGNASLVFRENDRPVLGTDPWLTGTCYFGSWALDRPLTPDELAVMQACEFLWISHGHPDHFHTQSIKLLNTHQKILLPDHYDPGIQHYLEHHGFPVEVMPYRAWKQLSPQIRVMCLDNENQDAILLIEAGSNLVVNLNDSPLCGEAWFIRDLVSRYDRDRTYAAALCSNDADMFNLVDASGRRVVDPPEQRKPGMVWALARTMESLGVGTYVSSASQHVYVRKDALWANPHRVGWSDVVRYWTRPAIRLVEPFVVLDLETGEYERKHPEQTTDFSQITDATADDDWSAGMTEAEWGKVGNFFRSIEILRPYMDYVEFTVGGETRRIWLTPNAERRPPRRPRGIAFTAPAQSLLRSVDLGYFDTILIGNFMTARLENMGLYPHFTPIVAKLAGSSRVSTFAAWRKFRWRYFRRNPIGYMQWHAAEKLQQFGNVVRAVADRLYVKKPLKIMYRRWLGDPVT